MWYERLDFSFGEAYVELGKNGHCWESVQIINWFFVGGRVFFEVGK